VTYAGKSGIALPPTKGNQRGDLDRLESLEPSGSTNGNQASSRRTASQPSRSFKAAPIVLVATDGDMGMTSRTGCRR
jgi:hypothetical protein